MSEINIELSVFVRPIRAASTIYRKSFDMPSPFEGSSCVAELGGAPSHELCEYDVRAKGKFAPGIYTFEIVGERSIHRCNDPLEIRHVHSDSDFNIEAFIEGPALDHFKVRLVCLQSFFEGGEIAVVDSGSSSSYAGQRVTVLDHDYNNPKMVRVHQARGAPESVPLEHLHPAPKEQ